LRGCEGKRERWEGGGKNGLDNEGWAVREVGFKVGLTFLWADDFNA
jgi:hypothetical protein